MELHIDVSPWDVHFANEFGNQFSIDAASLDTPHGSGVAARQRGVPCYCCLPCSPLRATHH
jgi:hypothetical protein